MLEAWANIDLYVPLSRIPEEARRIEALDYDVLSVPDPVHDGLAAAALAIQATERIRVTNTALIVFPRSPVVVAVPPGISRSRPADATRSGWTPRSAATSSSASARRGHPPPSACGKTSRPSARSSPAGRTVSPSTITASCSRPCARSRATGRVSSSTAGVTFPLPAVPKDDALIARAIARFEDMS